MSHGKSQGYRRREQRRKHDQQDVFHIKQVVNCQQLFEVEWREGGDNTMHLERDLTELSVQMFKDKCVKFCMRRHKWLQYINK